MGKTPSDFNDLHKKRGLHVVKKQVDSAVDAEKGIPYGAFIIKPRGVYWTRKEDEEPVFFCSYIKPVGLARTIKGEGYALVMEMKDPDRRLKRLILSLEHLHLAGGEVAKLEFSKRGGFFGFGIRTRQAFADFCNSIMAQSQNLPRVTLVSQSGWLKLKEDCFAYVLPDMVTGGGNEQVVLQSPEAGALEYAARGSVEEWRERIGRYCVGNSRLLLAVSLAFAGPLLEPMNRESGGFHIVGASSTGKSTVLNVAASTLGDPRESVKTMNATASAFEVQASLANDSVLLLDELGEAPPEQIGRVIYSLSNGSGRGRADQSGNARERRTWRLLFLTSGEVDLEAMMKMAGKRTHAGQELRHVNIPADTGRHGVFEDLHGHENGAALSEYLRQAVMSCHGSPLRQFLWNLVDERNQEMVKLVERIRSAVDRFKAQAVPQGADGQVTRVASRFALVAAGGELATEYGVTGWPVGAALDGVMTCFRAWLDRRGTVGKAEVESLIQQVEAFFEQHGESRFVPMESENIRGPARPVINRAGFRKTTVAVPSNDTVTEYFVLPSAFREMVTGFEPKWAAGVLAEKGLLRAGRDKSSVSVNLPGMGKSRCYHFPARADESEQAPAAIRHENPEVAAIDLNSEG